MGPLPQPLAEGIFVRAGGNVGRANIPGGERGKARGWFGSICYSSCTKLSFTGVSLTPLLEAGAGEQEFPSLTLHLLCLGGPAVMGWAGGVLWSEQRS